MTAAALLAMVPMSAPALASSGGVTAAGAEQGATGPAEPPQVTQSPAPPIPPTPPPPHPRPAGATGASGICGPLGASGSTGVTGIAAQTTAAGASGAAGTSDIVMCNGRGIRASLRLSRSRLPFTGFAVLLLATLGAALLGGGMAAREAGHGAKKVTGTARGGGPAGP